MASPLEQRHGGHSFPPNAKIQAAAGVQQSHEDLIPGSSARSASIPAQSAPQQARDLPIRPLHVNEALVFTPLASILPPDASKSLAYLGGQMLTLD